MNELKDKYREMVERIKKNYLNATKERLRNEDIADRLGYTRTHFASLTGTRAEVKEYHIQDLEKHFKDELDNTIKPKTYTEKRHELKLNSRFAPIPYHDIDIAAASSSNMELYDDKGMVGEDYYHIPEFSGCRAFNCFSDSMDPLIKKGSKIFAKRIEDWAEVLEYGQVYAIGLVDGRRFLKYIKKGSKEDRFLLVSENPHYEPFEVPFRLIRSVWIIDGSMDKMTQSTFFILKHNT